VANIQVERGQDDNLNKVDTLLEVKRNYKRVINNF